MNASVHFRSMSGSNGCYGNVISPGNENRLPPGSMRSRGNISATMAATRSNICFTMHGQGGRSDRPEAPNFKHQAPEKLQAPIIKHKSPWEDVCRLRLGYSLGFGAWDLE